MRSVLLVAIVLALAGFRLVLPVDRLATVYVVDLSDSVGQPGREDALAWLRESLTAMPKGDVAGIVGFGRAALVERLPQEVREIDRIASTPVRSATDIGAALRLASALFPDDAQKRIVLLSDGNDTTGTGPSEAALAAARGIQVETRAIGLGAANEVLVDRLTTPSTARIGEEIEATAEVHSTVAQAGHGPPLRRRRAGRRAGRRPRRPGANQVTFRVKPTEAGFHVFRVVVEAGRDTFSQNNRADSDTIVKGEPRVLVLAGDEGGRRGARRGAEDRAPAGRHRDPRAAPERHRGPALVRQHRPRRRLPAPPDSTGQLTALQQYVRDFGRGLVMIGGPKSYGAGGYTGHPGRGGAPGRHGRQGPPEAAGRGARRRHRQVRIDGRLPLQHVRPGRRVRDRRRPQGGHRQGGHPPGGGRDVRPRPARDRRPSTRAPTGSSGRSRSAGSPIWAGRSPGSSRSARRTSSPASTRR